MVISIKKTKAMHVRAQDKVSATTAEEASAVCKFTCPHLHCGFKLYSKRGMLVHAGKCEWKDKLPIDRILDSTGPVHCKQYLIKWKDFTNEHNTWEPRSHIHPEAIRDFEMANDRYVFDWPHRCGICDLPFRTARGTKIHYTRVHGKIEKQQVFQGRLADKAVQVEKLKKQQQLRPGIWCEDEELENVFKFKYLGTIFAADGLQRYDVEARIAKAMTRCGQLRHIFDSPHLGPRLKLRLYIASVCSLLSYGCETWQLNERTMCRLNGANSIMLSRITGNGIREEARAATSSYNLVRQIRRRRFKWLGQILRSDRQRLLHHMVQVQYDNRTAGDLLIMDAPPHHDFNDLINQAEDKPSWNLL